MVRATKAVGEAGEAGEQPLRPPTQARPAAGAALRRAGGTRDRLGAADERGWRHWVRRCVCRSVWNTCGSTAAGKRRASGGSAGRLNRRQCLRTRARYAQGAVLVCRCVFHTSRHTVRRTAGRELAVGRGRRSVAAKDSAPGGFMLTGLRASVPCSRTQGPSAAAARECASTWEDG